MATSTITNTITGPTGTALSGVRVIIRLMPGGSFRTATGAEVAPVYETETNGSGQWSATLEENAGITPANSYYEVEERLTAAQGGPRRFTFSVGASDQTLYAALVSPIPNITSQNYLTQAAADARYIQSPLTYAATAESRPNDAASGGSGTDVARANHVHDREITYGTAATRAALSGTDLYEGLRFRETDSNDALYTYRAAAWLQEADHFIVANAAARTAITNPYEGMLVYQADNNTVYRYDGTSWWTVQIAGNGTTSHTPQVDQGASTNIAKTVSYSQYRIINGECQWWFALTFTAGGTAGSGFSMTLPVAAISAQATAFVGIGGGDMFDASASTLDTGEMFLISTTQMSLHTSEGTTAAWGASPNIAIASGDIIRGEVRYLVASAA